MHLYTPPAPGQASFPSILSPYFPTAVSLKVSQHHRASAPYPVWPNGLNTLSLASRPPTPSHAKIPYQARRRGLLNSLQAPSRASPAHRLLPPPASAGAFSLCSKRLYALLAIPYLKCLHGHPPFSTAEFLRLLEPDLPDHIVCYYCEKLHKIKRLERHIKFTKRCDIPVNEAMRSYIHPRFSYVIFQMAMKRHRQGLDYSSPLKLLSYNEWSWIGPDEIKTSFRIVDGSLLLRQQHILLVHPNNDQMFTNTKIMICPHIKQLRGTINCQSSGMGRYNMVYTPGSIEIDHTPTAVECDCCAHQGKKDEGNWSGLVRCRDCATEFRVDTLGIGQSGKAYVVTRWKDLGEGRDANDSVWCAHMGEKGLLGGAGREAAGRSICVRFEGEGWRGGLESLVMPREMKRLVKYRYCFCEV
ncbi:hypothetical protein GMDG_08592 [Pseudogymnoascus destructans 20631-21]|uniref:Uncharacterized protein n=1 Tax=Pseudogymnoascus destructans (strain ATCC MYA-4855 / 20631-21) TaxID=658429 RepID=L8G7R2_PSED2|nr:hypothetical protein GMDG_08592 [Pseudogymnoascus destructans 20631-21]